MIITLNVSTYVAGRLAKVVHAEAIKVGRELMTARDDWQAAFRHHELVNNEVSKRMLDNSVQLVEDLTDEVRELLVTARELSKQSKEGWKRSELNAQADLRDVVIEHGHCSQ